MNIRHHATGLLLALTIAPGVSAELLELYCSGQEEKFVDNENVVSRGSLVVVLDTEKHTVSVDNGAPFEYHVLPAVYSAIELVPGDKTVKMRFLIDRQSLELYLHWNAHPAPYTSTFQGQCELYEPKI